MKDVKIQLNVMVGLPGSGKSSYINKEKGKDSAEKITPSGLWSLSADRFRELYPEIAEQGNAAIFNLLYNYLENEVVKPMYYGHAFNEPIYLDNTNLTLKNRKEIFRVIKKMEKDYPGLHFYTTGIVMSTPFEVCLERNKNRVGKVVPEEVIYKYRAGFNIPFYEEGFDQIKIINGLTLQEITEVECDNKKYAELMYKMINFEQENPHHRYTLGIHMSVCQTLVLKNAKKFFNSKCMYVAAAVHDWGKYYTKSYNANGYGIYYNHGEVGTYELLSHLELIPQKDFSMNEILRVLAYVNYHMKPFDWNTEKAIKKAYDNYYQILVNDLFEFNKIDKEACGTESEQILG